MSQFKLGNQISLEAEYWYGRRDAPNPEHGWEETHYRPRATVTPRKRVFPVRLNDKEMAELQELAKIEDLSAVTIVRKLIKE